MDIFETALQGYGLSPLPSKPVEAMAYVPFQQFGSKTYTPAQALESGTIYPVLDKPFYGSSCRGGKDD